MATKGSVKGIVSNLVTIEADGPVAQNEICYITVGGVPLMSEVIRVNGKNAYAQFFESIPGPSVTSSMCPSKVTGSPMRMPRVDSKT